jgi:hypothetical protein
VQGYWHPQGGEARHEAAGATRITPSAGVNSPPFTIRGPDTRRADRYADRAGPALTLRTRPRLAVPPHLLAGVAPKLKGEREGKG